MLSKQNRVSEKEVALLFKKAKSLRTPFFAARYLPEPGFKCAVIAPKTMAKTAVLRNKLRRQWYGSLERVLKVTKPKSGTYALVLGNEALKASPAERVDALTQFFNRAVL